jgi:hypothetical protein
MKKAMAAMPRVQPEQMKKIGSGNWQHPMEGMGRMEHAAHIRHHEREFMVLRNKLVGAEEGAKRLILHAMRQCARHRMQHLLHRHATFSRPQAKKLPTLSLKSLSKALGQQRRTRFGEGARGRSPGT